MKNKSKDKDCDITATKEIYIYTYIFFSSFLLILKRNIPKTINWKDLTK